MKIKRKKLKKMKVAVIMKNKRINNNINKKYIILYLNTYNLIN